MKNIIEGFVLGKPVRLDLQVLRVVVREISDDLLVVMGECWEEGKCVACFGWGGRGDGRGEEVVVEGEGVCGVAHEASFGGRCVLATEEVVCC